MQRAVVLATLIVVGGLTVAAFQAPPQPAGPTPGALAATKIEKVKDNLYMITGSAPAPRENFSGGNTAVFITDTGVVVVDTKLAGWGPTIIERIRTVTNKPVVMLINTHTHGDHTGSNNGFPATVDIVAHENTKANMMKMDAFKGDKAAFLPKKTFKDTMTLGSGKEQINLYYFGAGHTNGDAMVYFPALRVLQTGDLFARKDAPRIDGANGGSGVAYPQTLSKAVASLKNVAVDVVVPGHAPLMKWSDLQEYQRFTADLLNEVQAARRAGKNADAAAASINLSNKYKGYTSEGMKLAVQAIYEELK